MAVLDDVKNVLRISGNDFDTELIDLIEAARNELKLAGVDSTLADSTSDSLIKRAITVYCKAEFGFDNGEAERFRKSFDLIKQHLTLSTDYMAVE